jgi:hypothetical protein
MMKSDDLETRLSRLPRRSLPAAWRDQILNSAPHQTPGGARGSLSTASHENPSFPFLWRWAWGALAATWLVIFGLFGQSHLALSRLGDPNEGPSGFHTFAKQGADRQRSPSPSSSGSAIRQLDLQYTQRPMLTEILGEAEQLLPAKRTRRPGPGPKGEFPSLNFGHDPRHFETTLTAA